MAGNKQTIEQFSIDLVINSPQFIKQLQGLEAKVNAAAQRMEKRLGGAFNLKNKGAANFQKDLNRVVKSTETAAKQVNRLLVQAFNTRGSGNNFRQWVDQAQRASAEVEQAVSRANRRMGGTGRPRTGGNGGSGSSTPRATSEERLQQRYMNNIRRMADGVHAQMYGSTLERLNRGGHTEQASQFRSQVRDAYLRNRTSGDTGQFRRDIREAIAQQRSFLNAQRANVTSINGLGSATEGLIGKFAGLATGLFTLEKAVEYFKQSLVVGQERTQAATMLNAAFGSNASNITDQVNQYSHDFGMNKTEAQQQAAILRQTLPTNLFSDQEIPGLMRTESIFGHQTGMNQEAIGRFNYALPQIAASAHLQGQDWMQIANAAPAIVRPLLQLTGAKNVADMKKMAQSMSGAEFAKLMIKAMNILANNADVAAAAMNSMSANIGRYNQSVEDGQKSFFDGYQAGFKNLLGSLSNLFEHSQGSLNVVGRLLGAVFDDMASGVTKVDVAITRASGYWDKFLMSFENGFAELPVPLQHVLSDLGSSASDTTRHLVEVAAAFAGIRTAVGGISMLKNVFGLARAGGAAGAAAEGGAVAGSMASAGTLFGVAVAAVLAKGLGDLVFDKWIPAFDKYAHDKWGWGGTDGKQTSYGGNVIAGSFDEKILDWLTGKGSAPATKGPSISPYLPLAQAQADAAKSAAQRTQAQGPQANAPKPGELHIIVETPDGKVLDRKIYDMVNDFNAITRVNNMGDKWTGQNNYSPAVPLTRPQQQ